MRTWLAAVLAAAGAGAGWGAAVARGGAVGAVAAERAVVNATAERFVAQWAGAAFEENFDSPTGINHDLFSTSGWWWNGQPFSSGWDPGYWTVLKSTALVLKLKKDRFQHNGADVPYTSGELRSNIKYGAGCYSVCMKAAQPSGVATAFYIKSFGPQGNVKGSQFNEIDIEFIGKERNKMQTNFFNRLYDPEANSGSGNEQLHDVGFDVHLNYAAYSFRWRRGKIEWWVNDQLVRTQVDAWGAPTLPNPDDMNLQILANVWSVNKQAEEWAGPLDPNFYETDARFLWIHHEPGENCNVKTRCGDVPAGI